MEKKCKKCNLLKSVDLMVKSTLTKDGYLSVCKQCSKKRRLETRYPISVNNAICTKCKIDKTFNEFPKNPRKITGLGSQCLECTSKQKREKKYYKKDNQKKKERLKVDYVYRSHINESKRINSRKNFKTSMLNNARRRAKKKNFDFDLEISDLIIPDKCPILEVPFVLGTKGNYEYTPSIDRIDNSKGYIKGNIQIISKKANSMKNSASFKELLSFSNWITKNIKI